MYTINSLTMRKLLILLPALLLVACSGNEKKPGETGTENTEYLLNMDGVGPVTVGMKQSDLEQLTGKKIPLTNPTDTVSGSWMDSATIQYKDISLRLEFVRTYAYENLDSFHMRVTSVYTESPLVRTTEGIRVGSGKQSVIDAYPDKFMIMQPGYDHETDTVYSKTLYKIRVRTDWEGPEIVYLLRDNKVYGFEVTSYHDDEE